MTFSLSIATLF